MDKADVVIKSDAVFTGDGLEPFKGGVAVRGDKIVACGDDAHLAPFIGPDTEVRDFGDQLVMPGLIDVHTFYTGWALRTLGSDLSGIADAKEAVSLLRAWKEDHPDCAAVFGHNLPETLASEELAHDERLPRAARGACRVFGLHEHA